MMTTEYCPATEIEKIEQELWTLTLKGDDIEAYSNRFHELVLRCPELMPTESKKIERIANMAFIQLGGFGSRVDEMILARVLSGFAGEKVWDDIQVVLDPIKPNSASIAFWGADDEEISEGGIPRVIVLGYDGLPMQPAHDPDYVPEPMYPEYIPLEDEHAFPVEEQPLPPVDSPTAKSPGYVAESDPKEDPEEYEDDETEDGPVDYPMDEGDDDDGDSSGDDADDEDEDKEDEEEEEEHLASADSAVVVPIVDLFSLPEGTEPIIPPPSTDITTTGARITVRLQDSISLPPEAEVERLLAMPTPPPSPLISLSPPSAGERLARCTALSAHSSPPPVPSPLLPSSGCPTQIQTLRIASTQALVDAVTAALPSPPLPPSLYRPLPVNRRDDIPESERSPRKRSCLFALGPRYEVGESSTARPYC
ncbi:hypothetical protein Tco_0901402 [Tanacetum coccineum]